MVVVLVEISSSNGVFSSVKSTSVIVLLIDISPAPRKILSVSKLDISGLSVQDRTKSNVSGELPRFSATI